MNKHKNPNARPLRSDNINLANYRMSGNFRMPFWPHMRTERRIAELVNQRVWKLKEKIDPNAPDEYEDHGPRYPAMIEWLTKVRDLQKKEYDKWQNEKKAAISNSTPKTTDTKQP